MAVNPLQSSQNRFDPHAEPVDAAAVLSALKAGQTVEAVVLANLETGEARLALLGILLDVMPVAPVKPGDALTLTVVDNLDELSVMIDKRPPGPRRGDPATSVTTPASIPQAAEEGEVARSAITSPAATPHAPTVRRADVADHPLSPVRAERTDAAPAVLGSRVAARPAPSAEAKAALAAMMLPAAAGQRSRAPLLANAVALLAGPAGEKLPSAVRETLTALVASAIVPGGLDARALRHAVARSGTFQEASILRVAEAGRGTAADLEVATLKGDAKGAILALRSALRSLAGDVLPPPPRTDPPALPHRGTSGMAQQAVPPSIEEGGWSPEAARTLLGGAEGALDRIRLLQAASLPDERRASQAEQRADRLVEIPLAMADGRMPVMSLAVGRDRAPQDVPGEAPAWRMRLSLDLEETGPMHAIVSLRGTKAGVALWAERAETADLFRASLGELRDALSVADLDIDAIDVRNGAPALSQPAPAGSFLDRRT